MTDGRPLDLRLQSGALLTPLPLVEVPASSALAGLQERQRLHNRRDAFVDQVYEERLHLRASLHKSPSRTLNGKSILAEFLAAVPTGSGHGQPFISTLLYCMQVLLQTGEDGGRFEILYRHVVANAQRGFDRALALRHKLIHEIAEGRVGAFKLGVYLALLERKWQGDCDAWATTLAGVPAGSLDRHRVQAALKESVYANDLLSPISVFFLGEIYACEGRVVALGQCIARLAREADPAVSLLHCALALRGRLSGAPIAQLWHDSREDLQHPLTRRLVKAAFVARHIKLKGPQKGAPISIATAGLGPHSEKIRFLQSLAPILQEQIAAGYPSAPIVTLFTSVFRGGKWIRGFLANIVALSHFDRAQLVLINAASPEHEVEDTVIAGYLAAHPNIVYVKLDFDPGLYQVWNFAIQIASSDLVSNANLDDRQATEFITRNLQALHASPGAALVSSLSYVSNVANETLRAHEDRTAVAERLAFYSAPRHYGFADFFNELYDPATDTIRYQFRNIPHCMPIWRKSLHERHGWFDEAIGGPAADMEFWLRCAAKGETYLNNNELLGVYYYSNKETYSARNESSIEKIVAAHLTASNNLFPVSAR